MKQCLKIQIGKNNWDLETYRKSKKYMYLVHQIKPPILNLQMLRFGDFFNILGTNKQAIFQEKKSGE